KFLCLVARDRGGSLVARLASIRFNNDPEQGMAFVVLAYQLQIAPAHQTQEYHACEAWRRFFSVLLQFWPSLDRLELTQREPIVQAACSGSGLMKAILPRVLRVERAIFAKPST